MTNNFEKVNSSDFCKSIFDGTHDSPKYFEQGYPLVTSKYIINNKVMSHLAPLIRKNDFDQINIRSKVQRFDVLVSMIGTVGNIALITKEPDYAIKNIGVLRAKNELDARYLFYYMQSNIAQSEISNSLAGSTQPFLGLNQLRNLPILVPKEEALKHHIVNTIGSVDDLIEKNTRIIERLEKLTNLSFVQIYESNKENDSLSEYCSIILGGTPSRLKPEYWNGDIPWINSGEINKNAILEATEYITQLGLEKSSTKMMPKNTVVLAITGATLGQISVLKICCCANQSVIGIIPSNKLPFEYLFPLIKNKINSLINMQTGGAQQHINKDNVSSLPIYVLDNAKMRNYLKKVEPLFNEQERLLFENAKLQKIKQTLLNKFF